MRPSQWTHLEASLNEEITERLSLSPEKDEDLENLNVIHKLIWPHREEIKEKAHKSRDNKPKEWSLELASTWQPEVEDILVMIDLS